MHIYNEQKHHTKDKIFIAYSVLLPEDNFWRQLDHLVDFNFVTKDVRGKYNMIQNLEDIDIIRLFKYQLLKVYYNISDEELITNTDIDVMYKYFLEYEPIDMNFMNPSLITEFGNLIINEELIKNLNLISEELSTLKGISIKEFKEYKISTFLETAKIFIDNMEHVIMGQ